MWTFLGILLVVVVACAVIVVGLIRVAAQWGQEAVELQRDGVEVTGTVVEKRSYSRRGARSTHIRYEYLDQFGKRHRSRRTLVTQEAWDAHVEGGPITVVYSQRRPSISLPGYLFDLSKSPPRPL